MSVPGERWLTSRFTGVFTALDRVPLRAHDPRIALWAGTTGARGPSAERLVVGGAGWSSGEARDACLGEAVERFESFPRAEDGAVEASFATWPLDEPAVDPARWVLFSEAQYRAENFPFAPFTARTSTRWVAFRDVASGDPIWAPEDLATLHAAKGAHHGIASMSSTGLSAGAGAHPTVLRGVQEVIERDALVRAWWGEYPLSAHDAEEVFAAIGGDVAARVLRPNLTYSFLRVETPYSAHVTLVTVEGEGVEGFCFSVGSACRESRAESFRKALLEAVQGRHYARHRRGELAASGAALPEVPVDFAGHALYYSMRPERLAETVLQRAAAAREDAAISARIEPLGALLERLGAAHAPAFRLVTPPAVPALAPGLRVVKVVIPGLVPLHGDHRLAHLGASQWRDAPYSRWIAHPPHPFA